MEIYVHVAVEPADSSLPSETTTQAYFTFVALGPDGSPARVPRLTIDPTGSDDDERVEARRVQRLASKEQHRKGIRSEKKD